MNEKIRNSLKKNTPKFFRYHLKNKYRKIKSLKAKKIFEKAKTEPAWLKKETLVDLQHSYPYPPAISYDPESRKKSGKYRAQVILDLLGAKEKEVSTFLDLGCSEGMVVHGLRNKDKKAVGIDIRSEFYNGDTKGGEGFLQMDACRLGMVENSFDLVFSLAAFEHFPTPDMVLKEAIRVTKPGGYIYLHFGPLYMSPFGLHAYRSITVPYCQFLFPEKTLMDFCSQKNLQPPDFSSVNKWTLEDYRKLWSRYSEKIKVLKYYEYLNVDHLEIVTKHPSCFRSKTNNFKNLIVPELEVLFQKLSGSI